jgi:hypothetical protein
MRLQPKTLPTLLALVGAALFAGCGDDETTDPPDEVSFEVEATDLEPLATGHYEAWIAFPLPEGKQSPGAAASPLHGDLELISIGKFEVEEDGHLAWDGNEPPLWELAVARDVSFAAEGWISIEPDGDQDTIPSGLLLAGPFVGTQRRGTANLDASYRSIWDLDVADLDLSSLEGTFRLATPSDAIGSNEAQGLYWWIPESDSLRPDFGAGLETLPTLDGVRLTYEGWIQGPGGGDAISTGRFTSTDTLDSDAAGTGVPVVEETPRYPGQEFTATAVETLNAGGYSAFITLEPANDNDPARPTQFVLLSKAIGAGAATDSSIEMTNTTADLPTASMVINR